MDAPDRPNVPPTSSTPQRRQVLAALARSVPSRVGSDCVLVGIDGADGSGKTVFADELSEVLRSTGRPVVRLSVDDFHNVRAVRYRRGRESPKGFWLDSFDYSRLRTDVLEPLGAGGTRRYRPLAHDLASDEVVCSELRTAPAGSVVVIDGLFLHRRELADVWDFSIFLDVPFAVTARRMAARDGSNSDPDHPSMRRYVEAQRLYFAACDPKSMASVIVDNTILAGPRILVPGQSASDSQN